MLPEDTRFLGQRQRILLCTASSMSFESGLASRSPLSRGVKGVCTAGEEHRAQGMLCWTEPACSPGEMLPCASKLLTVNRTLKSDLSQEDSGPHCGHYFQQEWIEMFRACGDCPSSRQAFGSSRWEQGHLCNTLFLRIDTGSCPKLNPHTLVERRRGRHK